MTGNQFRTCIILAVELIATVGLAAAADGSARDETAAPSTLIEDRCADPEALIFDPQCDAGAASWTEPATPSYRPSTTWDPATLGRPYWRTNLIRRVANDQLFLVRSWWAAEARSIDFSVPLLVSMAAASGSKSSGVDLRLQRSIETWTLDGRRDLASGLSRLGDGKTGLILIGGSYLIARWAGNDRLAETASLSAEAALNAAIYSTALKKLSRRERPRPDGTGRFLVQDPISEQELTSFPSGHAMGAFAVATVIAAEYRHRRWVPWMAYGTATLIALSRVGLGRHFPSDVLAGAVLGRSLGQMVIHRSGDDDDRPVGHLEPIFDPATNGIGIAYRRSW